MSLRDYLQDRESYKITGDLAIAMGGLAIISMLCFGGYGLNRLREEISTRMAELKVENALLDKRIKNYRKNGDRRRRLVKKLENPQETLEV